MKEEHLYLWVNAGIFITFFNHSTEMQAGWITLCPPVYYLQLLTPICYKIT